MNSRPIKNERTISSVFLMAAAISGFRSANVVLRELMEVVEWLDEVLLASKHGPPKRAAKDDPLH
jgi:hypothetical protein